MKLQSKVKNIKLASQGKKKLDWAADHMPVVSRIAKKFSTNKPFRGLTVGVSLHITKETGILLRTLKKGGATVAACGCNPLSTQDDVAAALAKEKIHVFAWRDQSNKDYYQSIDSVLAYKPDVIIDDGADMVSYLHTRRKDLLGNIRGGCEETVMGVNRLKVMEREGVLAFPMIAVNDAYTKHLFDNRYGTGQSSMDGILRATSVLVAGKNVVIVGYGWCGRGAALRAKGLGANVIVCEVDPIKALEAIMDGYRVMPMAQAAKIGDIFLTVTSNADVIRYEHIKTMQNGSILANAGHADKEIDVAALRKNAVSFRDMRPNTVEYTLPNKKVVYLLGEGRIINLVSAEGHPSEVMDMSFATQALSAAYIVKNYQTMEIKVYDTKREQDATIAQMKLTSMGIAIDRLNKRQKEYLSSWQEGT